MKIICECGYEMQLYHAGDFDPEDGERFDDPMYVCPHCGNQQPVWTIDDME
ncbi:MULTISPECIES: hypothetical protein [Paenibacillus]|uniref:hypothetical protein n=1 Tax=Paenibacillus TaxID=44249 RepID=UPI000EC95B7E|nr:MULTISPECIES: hypothetical protein [Paenibacillus]GBK72551.1 hypothetical protein PbJCM17693_62590 [Paenibacillus macerans]